MARFVYIYEKFKTIRYLQMLQQFLLYTITIYKLISFQT